MIDILSVENMRKSDAATIAEGTPGTELMMRAARGVFECNRWTAPVAIICGSGNNAGDGYALALLLYEAGIDLTVFCVYDRFSDDGRFYYDKLAGTLKTGDKSGDFGIERWSDSVDLSKFGTVVDCLLGTGFKGEVRSELRSVIEAVNATDAVKISVDINSGLNGDTGMADICVRSDLTVSIGSFKPGHFLNMAKDVMKEKTNCDIGIKPVDEPYKLIEASDIEGVFGKRPNYSNKGTYGYTALIGGSTRYSGAIRLAYLANASMRSGAGVAKVAVPSSIVHDVASQILESTLFPLSCHEVMSTNTQEQPAGDEENGIFREDSGVAYVPEEIDELISNVKTVAFGMGIGTGEGAAEILEHLLTKYKGTLIIDADGLTLLSKMDRTIIKNATPKLVLTPHIKEFSRLTGMEISQILEDPTGIAKKYASETGAVVLLKGPSTIVTDGEKVYITDRGCAGMATAGSGDVLSGITAALCCKEGADLCLLVSAAAFINGAAGELAEERIGAVSMTAADTAGAIAEVIRNIV